MKTAQITTLGGPTSLELVDAPSPDPGTTNVLIDVRAAGVAFPEVLQSRGLYQVKPDLPFIPGAEVAGTVAAAPEGSGLAVGQRVAALPLLGGFAEQVACSPDAVFPIPDSLSYEAAAAIPFNYLTAHFALLHRGRLAAGESVLVHGAAGGIGSAAIQVAKAFDAGRVIAVTSTEEKGEAAVAAGADEYVLADSFREAVTATTGGKGVDIVVDPVGGDRFTDSLRSLATDGRALVVGFTAGSIPEVKVNRLLLNNLDVVGVAWGAYALARPGYLQRQWAHLLPKIEAGFIEPLIGETYPLDRVTDALLSIDERRAVGKILLGIRD
ncbi:Alcohol dehydrogenase zinc-binding domain protein OS=Tsukamurella paurometabola (strain ATCC 8368/ DSM / CCUG 35730 / CIP 100753 / JCM 10117 / KCTC 9821/ NBRC 16120 / NCIMB 702349 / NCTC 13040) OX=521096 GN=Tpau_1382 PE=4 SV=1 [Tsukamurella paurometabola]|uniref:Alcohol dehydrogenase zinc-binding domain protein n=1 Tax=Tsukamurella paurometabola (strain ATCC 8368 / DSM 20162 / CCUG 35730 / CIP 100753 / JCM 10117 / KCTC 9821 / NBRC 16120 / NCIMB 702349 / NCTC 13040) TaxID=521096 RepID=D5UWY8_TSUPD|nr:NADPH:quinone oxidoreductase family protein [Tsukamurella paurometabola]ADG78010.1 Alcohol dehydrogenase zinc-binding domain protein [Tsukamurella paurometabola DSM 20162]SUP29769.1 Beta-ketoacyl-acyl-carrier-protein synthase I [Tsukamurella paurometabola]